MHNSIDDVFFILCNVQLIKLIKKKKKTNNHNNMNSIECNNYYGTVTFIEEIIKTLAYRKLDKTNLQHNKLYIYHNYYPTPDSMIMIVKN